MIDSSAAVSTRGSAPSSAPGAKAPANPGLVRASAAVRLAAALADAALLLPAYQLVRWAAQEWLHKSGVWSSVVQRSSLHPVVKLYTAPAALHFSACNLSEDRMMKSIWTLALFGSVAAALALAAAALAAGPKEKNKVKDPTTAPPAKADANSPASPLDFTVKDIDGKEQKLADYKGKVVLMVNVASRCGNTPQYEGLEALYKKYQDKGLVIIGFPANNFGGQEPGSEAEIKQFCTSKYNVTFPMMSKISVKGDDKAPLYAWLTGEKTNPDFAGDVTWNFGKFLVDRNGNVIGRFDPGTKPSDPKVVGAVEKAIAAKAAGEEKKG